MKNTILIIALFFAIDSSSAQEIQEKKADLTVTISGFSSNQGKAFIAIYNKKDTFLKTQLKGSIAEITDNKATYTFKDLHLGEYAVSMFHDENSNNKMDTNFLGIPKEDYGCSNNAKGFMGPPKYDDAKFQLTEDKTINIKL